LYVFEPPSRPDEILLRRAGCAGISPGRQEGQGKIFCFAGMPQSKNKAFHLAVINKPRRSRMKRKASSLTKTGYRFWSRQLFFCRYPAKENWPRPERSSLAPFAPWRFPFFTTMAAVPEEPD